MEILEEPQSVPEKYSLSARAARGILRRAQRRGRTLPVHLAEALEAVATSTTSTDQERHDAGEDGTGRGTPLVTRAYSVVPEGGQGADLRASEVQVSPGLAKTESERGVHVVQQGVRRLTPTECERLQGFPDGWTDLGPDSRRYAALGDAVTVNVAEWIGSRILSADSS
ncbi:MAG TPA: DNA cytosine methyltransferase [Planctomycetota bacterium]|nr:DNA cytosine methyltransferase [Planctomycetota bacterium]